MARESSDPTAHPVRGAQLAGLLDGELNDDEQQRVFAHLAECPSCAASFERQQRTQAALRTVGTGIQPPPAFRQRVHMSLQQVDDRGRFRQRLAWLSGVAAVLCVLVVGGWGLRQRAAPIEPALVRAMEAYQAAIPGGAPAAFASEDPQAVGNWARSVTGRDVDVPSFAARGYRLMGARAEPSVARGAVSLLYGGPDGNLTCVIVNRKLPLGGNSHTTNTSAVHVMNRSDVSAAGWWEDGETYVLVASQPPATVLELVQLAQDQS